MLMGELFEKFAKGSPVAVMARAMLERALEPEGLDRLFEQSAERQYLKQLTFSSMVDVMAAVVCGLHPSVRSAHNTMRAELPVTLTALYEKLNRLEVPTLEALVRYSATQLGPVLNAVTQRNESWLTGYRIKVLDGNHLAATDRRLEVLRGSVAGPLPGLGLVVIQPEMGLVTQLVACEDGHAQERSLLGSILVDMSARDVYIADRNFCTLGFLFGTAERDAYFVIRQHAKLPIVSAGTLRQRGRTETGVIFEQKVTLRLGEETLSARRIVIRLDNPTRDGDAEIAIITNLPAINATALVVAELYHRRWSIESLFARIERNLKSELSTLGYPGAALFAFAVALVVNNVFAVVLAAMETAKNTNPDPKIANMPLSHFRIVEAIRTVHVGMSLVVEDEAWAPFQNVSATAMARLLVRWAKNIDWRCFEKAVQRSKKPPSKRTRFTNHSHVSTAKLLGRVPVPADT